MAKYTFEPEWLAIGFHLEITALSDSVIRKIAMKKMEFYFLRDRYNSSRWEALDLLCTMAWNEWVETLKKKSPACTINDILQFIRKLLLWSILQALNTIEAVII